MYGIKSTDRFKHTTKLTLNALEIVAFMLSRINPPANVPKIPQTIVTPPNNKSALFCQKKFSIYHPFNFESKAKLV